MKKLLSIMFLLTSWQILASDEVGSIIQRDNQHKKIIIFLNQDMFDFYLITGQRTELLRSIPVENSYPDFDSHEDPYLRTKYTVQLVGETWQVYGTAMESFHQFCHPDWSIKRFLLCYFPIPSAAIIYPGGALIASAASAGLLAAATVNGVVDSTILMVKKVGGKENVSERKLKGVLKKGKEIKINKRNFDYMVEQIRKM